MATMNAENQGGFTLIELISVIVILGILAAVALPKFASVKADAQYAAMQGVAGAVSSAFAVNYAGNLANSTKGVAVTGAALAISAVIGSIMNGGSLPAGYSVSANAALISCSTGASAGSTNPVTITNSSFTAGSNSVTATLICTG